MHVVHKHMATSGDDATKLENMKKYMAGRQEKDNAKVLETLDENAVIDMKAPKKAVYTGKANIETYLTSKSGWPYVEIVSVDSAPTSLEGGKATIGFKLNAGVS